MLSVGLVSCHQYGLAVYRGVQESSAQIKWVITLPRGPGRALVGTRYESFSDALADGSNVVQVADARLGTSDLPSGLDDVEVVLVAGWPRLISEVTLDFWRQRQVQSFGFHPSLLPRGRGVNPIAWQVLAHPEEAGLTVFELTSHADDGRVAYRHPLVVRPEETSGTLFSRATLAHKVGAMAVVRAIQSDALELVPQDESLASSNPRLPDHSRELHPWTDHARQTRAWAAPYGWARMLRRNGDFRVALGVIDGQPYLSDETFDRSKVMEHTGGLMGDATLDPTVQETEPERAVDRLYSGAILQDREGTLFLQRRDSKPGIVNPGMITLFGGVTEGDEGPDAAMIRELNEELGIDVSAEELTFLGTIDKVERDTSVTRCHIYVVAPRDMEGVEVFEGEGFAAAPPSRLLSDPDLSAVARAAVEKYVSL